MSDLIESGENRKFEDPLVSELASSIEGIVVKGKFPNGLVHEGTTVVPPTSSWREDYKPYSLKGDLNFSDDIRQDLALNLVATQNESSGQFLKHFIVFSPDGESTVCTLGYAIDHRLTDAVGRFVSLNRIQVRLPSEHAMKLDKLVRSTQSADIIEQLVQKITPDFFRDEENTNTPGFKRVLSDGIAVLDETFFSSVLPQNIDAVSYPDKLRIRQKAAIDLKRQPQLIPYFKYNRPVGKAEV